MDKNSVSLSGRQTRVNNPLTANLYQSLWQLLDWIYPPVCAGCKKTGYRFCPDCEADINYLQTNLCQICGQPIKNQIYKKCKTCQENVPTFTAVRSLAIYGGCIREAILKMKFHQDFGISEYFGFKIAALVNQLNWHFDMITPVPLNKFRQQTRGFNQAYRLAIPIALVSGKPICENALMRNINTLSQAELPKESRIHNVMGAFTANPKLVQGKSILLVDDIATTSSTINACSTALLEQKAAQVFGITIARAVL